MRFSWKYNEYVRREGNSHNFSGEIPRKGNVFPYKVSSGVVMTIVNVMALMGVVFIGK